MSVSFGSPATSGNLNNAFVSKSADSTVVSKVTLNKTGSGDSIDDTQLEINNKTFTPYAVEAIGSGGTITTSTTKGMQRRKVASSGGALTASTTPFGVSGGWVDGTQIRIRGNSDTNTLKIVHNDADYGCILNGDIVLTKFAQITVEWDNDELRWYEISRNI